MELQTAIDLDATTNDRVVLLRRPRGLLSQDDVSLEKGVALPPLADGEALIEVGWIGIDATVRTWLSQAEGYLPAVEIGDAVRASGIGRVVATRCETFPLGHHVYGLPGWQRYGVVRDDPLATHLGEEVDAPALLSVYGATGLTAYVGMVDVAGVKAGDTVVVSAAAGATGSLAAQIAKIHGARVIGICGRDDKAAWLTGELGLDGAINHATEDVGARLKELCPERVDVYFDNVGGAILDAVLDRLAMHARVVLCGAIAIYNEHGRPPGPANYFQLINRRARMEGFLSLDHWDRFAEVAGILGTWMAEGRLRYRTELYEGLGSAVDALNALFTGANTGKTVIRL
ncbi:MAG TPA: NADP-dependent oxidoreductase [Acidimicrobiales bacterium]|nr:NADP-dependent oxidoreductase [Acidimicrobiales bacterium]